MFSQNGKISDRQLFRMIIVGSLGPSLLICPKLLSGLGSMGFIVYLAAAVLSVGYILGEREVKVFLEIWRKVFLEL